MKTFNDASATNITNALGGQPLIITGTSYTFSPKHAGRIIHFTNSSEVTVTLPNGMAKGIMFVAVAKGAGGVTFSVEGTLEAAGTTLATQYTAATVHHEGANVWGIYGDLS